MAFSAEAAGSCELLIGLLQLEQTDSPPAAFSLPPASDTLVSLVRLEALQLLALSSASSLLLVTSKLSCLAAETEEAVDLDLGHRQFMQTTLRLSLQNWQCTHVHVLR